MKRKYRGMAALTVAASMALSLLGGPTGGIARGAESNIEVGGNVDMVGDGICASSDEDADAPMTDQDTGFSYVLYAEDQGEGVSVQKAEITGYAGTGTELVIPQKIGNYDVASIGDGAFKENGDITSVIISEGIATIGFEAFRGCPNLAKVVMPASAEWRTETSDGYKKSSAFSDCAALRELTLTEGLKSLGSFSFSGCTSLEEVTVPSTIERFYDQVFADCSSLKKLTLKEGIKEIGGMAFARCTSLEEVTIPSTIECWGISALLSTPALVHDSRPFSGCVALKKITLQEGIKTLKGFQGWIDCPLIKEVEIPSSVEDIEYAFAGCKYLEKVTLHDGLEVVGNSAFRECAALQEVRVPDTVTKIENYAFLKCVSLERLVLPPSLQMLGGGAITLDCSNLKEIYLLAETIDYYNKLPMADQGKLFCIEGSDTYKKYQAGMASNQSGIGVLAAVPSAGAEVQDWSIDYDGNAHDGVILKGIQEGDEILYRMADGEWQTQVPQVAEMGNYSIEVMVKRFLPGQPMQYSHLTAQTQVKQKKRYTMHISDQEVTEGQSYVISVKGYEGSEEPAYTYYNDAACQMPCDGKPMTAGVYYVRAAIPETKDDAAVESNVAKIVIHGKEAPIAAPSREPDASQPPVAVPSGDPSSGVNPSGAPSSSANPSGAPSSSANPSGVPASSANPSGNPSSSAKPEESQKPSPSVKPIQTQKPQGQNPPKVGKVTVKKVKSTKKKTVQVQWKKVGAASGYQIQVALNSKFTKGKKNYTITKGKTTKKTIKKLKRKKKYYVRIRAYRNYQGMKRYGGWSKVKKVKVK